MDAKLMKHDEALRVIWQELQPLVTPASLPPKKEIGFHVRNESTVGGTRPKSNKISK
jgi:hypothetical protein